MNPLPLLILFMLSERNGKMPDIDGIARNMRKMTDTLENINRVNYLIKDPEIKERAPELLKMLSAPSVSADNDDKPDLGGLMRSIGPMLKLIGNSEE